MANYNIFDDEIMAYRNAMRRINLAEEANPMIRGEVVGDADTYNKVKQLLNCQDMEHAHKFLLDIDFDSLTPEIVQKVDSLYQLAVSQGYIKSANPAVNDFEDGAKEVPADPNTTEQTQDGGYENAPEPNPDEIAQKDAILNHEVEMPANAYTCLYSAMKNGEIKTGECYSNATSIERAKQEAVQKLSRLGFTAVEIIAVEENDLDARGSGLAANPYNAGTAFTPPVVTNPVPTKEGPDKQSTIDNAPAPEAVPSVSDAEIESTEEPAEETDDVSDEEPTEEPTEDEEMSDAEVDDEIDDEVGNNEDEEESEPADEEETEGEEGEEESDEESEDEESEESEEKETDEEESDDEDDENEKLAEAYQKVLRGSLITEEQSLPSAIKEKIDSYARDYEAEVRKVVDDPEKVKAILDATDSLAKDTKAREKLLDTFLEDDLDGFLDGFGNLFGIDPDNERQEIEEAVENAWWELVEKQPRAALMYQLQGVGSEILDDVLNATGMQVSEAKKPTKKDPYIRPTKSEWNKIESRVEKAIEDAGMYFIRNIRLEKKDGIERLAVNLEGGTDADSMEEFLFGPINDEFDPEDDDWGMSYEENETEIDDNEDEDTGILVVYLYFSKSPMDEAKEEDKSDKKDEPENKEEEKDEEPEETEDEPEEKEPEELGHDEKIGLFKSYLSTYKNLLKKMQVTSYQDFDLAGRAKFYEKLAKEWGNKPSPTEFMTDANVKQIENMKVKVDK